MFLYVFGVCFYLLLGLFLILIILVQKGRGSAGLGALGGGAQVLFGGSGGQELFQKITWGAGALFILMSLGLALAKRNAHSKLNYRGPEVPVMPAAPTVPAHEPMPASSTPTENTQQ